jgi:hypothetical protein
LRRSVCFAWREMLGLEVMVDERVL